MDIKDISTLSSIGVIVCAVASTLTVNFYKMFKSTKVEKTLETYNQKIFRHFLICLLWWIVVIVSLLTKINPQKFNQLDWVALCIVSFFLFVLIVLVYLQYQNFSVDMKKTVYFVYKSQKFKFINRVDSNNLLLKKVKKQGDDEFKLLTFSNFTFNDKFYIKEEYSSSRIEKAFNFYKKLVEGDINFTKIRFYISFSLTLIGFVSSFSLILNTSLWTFVIFIFGLLMGVVAFSDVATSLIQITVIGSQLRKHKNDFDDPQVENRIKVFILMLLLYGVLVIGAFINLTSYILIGMILIIIGSIFSSYLFINAIVLKSERKFIKINSIEMTFDYFKKIK